MAAYVRTLDTDHLLTVGEEGFYADPTESNIANPEPPNSWAAQQGQDFVPNHQVPVQNSFYLLFGTSNQHYDDPLY